MLRSTAEFKAAAGTLHPLVQMESFEISMFQPDYMHSDLLGVRLQIIGSCLYELCGEGVFGHSNKTSWKDRVQEQLDVAP